MLILIKKFIAKNAKQLILLWLILLISMELALGFISYSTDTHTLKTLIAIFVAILVFIGNIYTGYKFGNNMFSYDAIGINKVKCSWLTIVWVLFLVFILTLTQLNFENWSLCMIYSFLGGIEIGVIVRYYLEKQKDI